MKAKVIGASPQRPAPWLGLLGLAFAWLGVCSATTFGNPEFCAGPLSDLTSLRA